METRVRKMKSLVKIFLVSFCVVITACSDEQVVNQEQAQRHITSAKIYMEQGQYRAAIIEAKNVVQLNPDSAEGYITLAQIYNEIGSYASAQHLLEQVVKKNPDVATELAYAYFLNKKALTAINTVTSYPAEADKLQDKQRQAWISAMSNISLGNKDGYELALGEFKDLGGSDAEVKYIQASYLLSKGELENAQAELSVLLEQAPDHLDALTMIAGINIYLRNLEQAEKYLTKALGQLKKTDILSRRKGQIISLLTDTLIQQGRTSEAYTYQKLLAEANPEGNAAQQRFTEAMEYYQQGNFAEAEKILHELREQYTATLLGLVEYQQGADKQAADLFDEFIDPETATPSVLQAAALVKFRNNQMDEAIELLRKAAESQPNNHIVLATYGLALLDKEPKSLEGAKALEKSLALEPKQQRIRIALARRHLLLEQPEQAVAQLQKAFQEEPNDFYIQQAYFKALLDTQQTSLLEEEITAFKNKDPQNSRGYFFAGWYQLQKKNHSVAEQEFEKAVAVKNSTEKHFAYAGLAQSYEAQDQTQKAIAAWQHALEAEPGMVMGYARWFAQMRKLKREDSAISFVSKLEEQTGKWEPSVVLAQLYVEKNQIPAAIKHIEIALTRSNNATNIKQMAANLYRMQGIQLRGDNKLTEARESLMQAVKLFPENADYLAVLIETEIAAKNIPEAQKLLDEFAKTADNESERLFLQGLIFVAEDKQKEGFQFYVDSWNAKPMEVTAERIYAYHLKADEKAKAEKFLDEWYAKLPNSPRAPLLLAVNAQGKNDPKNAISWYEKSVELNPQMPAALNNLAWMYYETKDPRALEYAKKAYELAPDIAAIADTYGWILVERGDLQKGIELLTRAAALEPDNQEILYHLNEAKSRQ
jgi:tetratricopeptide (TPR) repeat protein